MSWRITKGDVAWVGFMLLFTLLLLEIGGRWYLSNVLQKSSERKFQFDSYRIYSHVPGFVEHDDDGPRLTINSQGFRRTSDVIVPKPEGTFRIFFMGGSAAHGISSGPPFEVGHVRDNETVDAYLEQMLRERFPGRDIEVINAAVTGYQVFQHTAYILSELLDYEPDLFIFFDGFNDHFKHDPNEDLYRDNTYQFWAPRLQQPGLRTIFDSALLWASEFSGFARGMFAWRNNRDAEQRSSLISVGTWDWNEQQLRDGYHAASRRGYLRAVGHNLALLQYHGVDAILCLQPALMFRDTTVMPEFERKMYPLLYIPFRATLLPLIINDLTAMGSKFDVPFVDVNPAFDRREYAGEKLFLDYCHLTPLGGLRAAEALLPTVEMAVRKSDLDTLTSDAKTPIPWN